MVEAVTGEKKKKEGCRGTSKFSAVFDICRAHRQGVPKPTATAVVTTLCRKT